jgi:hypothetical protein
VVPEFGDGAEIVGEIGGLHQLETLGIRLEHAVLDAVVDHLGKVAGT